VDKVFSRTYNARAKDLQKGRMKILKVVLEQGKKDKKMNNKDGLAGYYSFAFPPYL